MPSDLWTIVRVMFVKLFTYQGHTGVKLWYIWSCSWLLRGLGAFFIKRRMDPVQGRRDTVYRAVLHTYMMACLRAGHNIEFFIEGGRTRTGKACLPKGEFEHTSGT